MKVINDTSEQVDIRTLKPHPKNPNRGDNDAIAASIQENGFYGVIIAQRSTGHVLAGNHRLEAARQMGAKEVPVMWVDVDNTRALKILLADNKTASLAHRDEQTLADLLSELQLDGGIEGTGYTEDDLDSLIESLSASTNDASESTEAPEPQIDRAEELRAKWQTERGQLWLIPSKTVPGKHHRLLCGDSTNAEDVKRLLAGHEVRMLWSDPPYGLGGYKGRGDSLTAVIGDDAEDETIAAFYKSGEAPEMYIWCEYRTYQHLIRARGLPRSLIVWGKNVFGMGSGYRRQHEFCGYYGNFKSTTESDLWLESRSSDYMHPTQKPATLAARAIRNSTTRGQIIHSPFGGSGDANVAAEQEGRLCYGMEYEPKYIAVILQRLSDMGLTPHQP